MKSNIIYIISANSKFEKNIKIGITNNLEKRLRNISTGNPEKTILEYHEEVPNYIKITELEDWLHSVFGLKRKSGEWFSDLTVLEIRKKIYRFLIK